MLACLSLAESLTYLDIFPKGLPRVNELGYFGQLGYFATPKQADPLLFRTVGRTPVWKEASTAHFKQRKIPLWLQLRVDTQMPPAEKWAKDLSTPVCQPSIPYTLILHVCEAHSSWHRRRGLLGLDITGFGRPKAKVMRLSTSEGIWRRG